ncbi:MAG: hypothetical protein ABI811_09885 [Acidobacteriota bacterium]
MKTSQILFLIVAAGVSAFAGDISVPAPEVGLDAATVAGAIGLIGSALLIVRGRRK